MEAKVFSPARLAPILGVSESTLKRWVDSGLLRGTKTAGGHRRIALPDIIAFLRARESPVPSLEALGILAERRAAPAGASVSPEALASLLLSGEATVARVIILGQFRTGRVLEDLLDRLLAPAMVHIGQLWTDGKADVYQERLATQCAWRILTELRDLLPAPVESAPLALGGAPEGDPYLLPTLMAELTLAERGWRTLNLGPDIPASSFREAVIEHSPRLVWLSITSTEVRPRFFSDYPMLWEAAGATGAAVMVGGRGVTAEVQDRIIAGAFGTRLSHLKAFAQRLR